MAGRNCSCAIIHLLQSRKRMVLVPQHR
jgi:hypothetical protein